MNKTNAGALTRPRSSMAVSIDQLTDFGISS